MTYGVSVSMMLNTSDIKQTTGPDTARGPPVAATTALDVFAASRLRQLRRCALSANSDRVRKGACPPPRTVCAIQIQTLPDERDRAVVGPPAHALGPQQARGRGARAKRESGPRFGAFVWASAGRGRKRYVPNNSRNAFHRNAQHSRRWANGRRPRPGNFAKQMFILIQQLLAI